MSTHRNHRKRGNWVPSELWRCIWCGIRDQESFKSREHYIARGLGSGQESKLLRGTVCDHCNHGWCEALDSSIIYQIKVIWPGITRSERDRHKRPKQHNANLSNQCDESDIGRSIFRYALYSLLHYHGTILHQGRRGIDSKVQRYSRLVHLITDPDNHDWPMTQTRVTNPELEPKASYVITNDEVHVTFLNVTYSIDIKPYDSKLHGAYVTETPLERMVTESRNVPQAEILNASDPGNEYALQA